MTVWLMLRFAMSSVCGGSDVVRLVSLVRAEGFLVGCIGAQHGHDVYLESFDCAYKRACARWRGHRVCMQLNCMAMECYLQCLLNALCGDLGGARLPTVELRS